MKSVFAALRIVGLTLGFLAALLAPSHAASIHGAGYAGVDYYISPTGSDSNNGLTAGAPWASPNHTVNCGDRIHAAAGAYNVFNFTLGSWGVVQNCPSASGVYAAQIQCAGPHVDSCSWSSSATNAMYIDQSNWSILGGIFSSSLAAGGACIVATPSSAHTIHHIALINVIASGCYGNGLDATGYSSNYHFGVDEFAVVGSIVYNGAQGNTECFSGFSDYVPVNFDTNPGTHVFVAGLFAWGNIDPNPCFGGLPTDGQAITFDNWNGSQQTGIPYTGQGVIEQSLLIGNGGYCINIGANTANPAYVTTTTCWGNIAGPNQTNTVNWGEMGVLGSFNTHITKSIFQAVRATTPTGANVYAFDGYLTDTTTTLTNSYLFGVSGQNWHVDNSGGFVLGSGVTQATPNFVAPAVPGAPNCSAYATVTDCMASVAANFVPQAAGAAGFGYQSPGACAPDALYPTWLKGLVPAGLITKPCNM